jgi:hypothetical protein
VASGDTDMGCSIGRFDGDGASRRSEIEWHIRTMLGMSDHRPPRLSWERLIEQLAADGIVITEAELMALPLAIDFDSRLARELNQ